MSNEQIFANNFMEGMISAKKGFTEIGRFKKSYPTLYAVIIKSMDETERLANSRNLQHLK